MNVATGESVHGEGSVSAPVRRAPARALVELGLPIAALAWFGRAWLVQREFILVDDAYISFRYARNLAFGWGPVWNVGEHVEGYTNALWILLLAPFARLRMDLVAPGVALSFAFCAAALVLQRHLVRRALPDAGMVLCLLPGMLLSTNPSWTHTATSAMETSCFAFFVLAALFCLVRSREEPRLRSVATFCFCAAYLARPEGALVAAVALGVELLSTRGAPSARLRRLVPVGAALAAVIGVHLAFRLSYYGYPFPNTYYAKVILGPITRDRGVVHALAFLRAGGWIALPGVVETLRRSPLRAYFVHGYALFFVYFTYLVLIGGDHPYWFRFYVPLLPLPCVATSSLVARIGAAVGEHLPRFIPRRAALAAGVFAALGLAGLVGRDGYPHSEVKDMAGWVGPGYSHVMRDIAGFFRQDAPRGSLIAALPVGYVGYYVPAARILDMWGLNDEHIAHLDVQPTFKFGHDKFDLFYIGRQKPDYTLVFRPLDWPAAPPVPGYDVCWPSKYAPFSVYRRAYPLAPGDAHLGVPRTAKRYLEPPPRCVPPPPPS
jgi:arabinofuranosyltransferase